MTTLEKPRLSFWAIWNMSFGFLGIQFGWGLQMANMSAIYKYLGAADNQIAWLWIAAPITGLLIQPVVGQMSDRCWTGIGRRRPFILGGAILTSCALLLMPNSPSLWMAAGLLWLLDGSINASMQPFRALVADNTPEEQNSQGFAMQSVFIGLGGTVSSALPWMMTNWFGVEVEEAAGGHIPSSVKLSFYIGALACLLAVLYTVFTTKEYPPSSSELAAIRSRKFDWTLGLGDIFGLILRIPRRMWELGLVQFFTWIALFCMWIYFSPAVAKDIFHASPDSKEFGVAVEWSGFCFAVYNAVCFFFSFVLIVVTRRVSAKIVHTVCLLAGAAGLISVFAITDKNMLLLSMVGVGIAWASILSMPYAMVSTVLPKENMGAYMGIFNLFIVIPQVAATLGLGAAMEHLLNNDPLQAVVAGGVCFIIAALLTLRVRMEPRNPEAASARLGGSH
jgi:maltose/moltooligosaccharide transporter